MSEHLILEYETQHYLVKKWTNGMDLLLKGNADRVPPAEAARDLREIADWIERVSGK